jgi:oxygen-independent coproporphyrinogen-3 oxidase
LLAFGVSAIGKVDILYSQNAKTLDAYYAALDSGRLPTVRGYEMSTDDLMRYAIIQSLMCHFGLSFEAFEQTYAIEFRDYFAPELKALAELETAGLCEVGEEWITITTQGRMLVRVIAMVFDRYLRERQASARYSKII